MKSVTHSIPAIEGVQAGSKYYTAMLTLRETYDLIPRIDETDVVPDKRRQRQFSVPRAKKIIEYLKENREEYTLPAVTISIDGKCTYERKKLSFENAKCYPNDGQHRLGAIRIMIDDLLAICSDEELKEQHKDAENELKWFDVETIAATIYIGGGIAVAQQRFSDINKNASRPNTAISLLFDHRDPVTGVAKLIASEVFEGRVEMTKASVSKNDGRLFTINGIAKSVQALADYMCEDPSDPTSDEYHEIREVFESIDKAMSKWWAKSPDKVVEMRNDGCLAVQNIGLQGICQAIAPQKEWKPLLKGLKTIDWSKSNSLWKRNGVVVTDGGSTRIMKSTKAIDAMGRCILRSLQRG
jgi:DNA sulfur modification protein DndB